MPAALAAEAVSPSEGDGRDGYIAHAIAAQPVREAPAENSGKESVISAKLLEKHAGEQVGSTPLALQRLAACGCS